MNLVTVKELYRNTDKYIDRTVEVGGWVRSVRDSKTFGFIVVNDGSFFEIQTIENENIQYFINSIILNNSNDVVTFNLEFDEWHNNVDEFYEKNRNREQIFERLTYDGFTKKIDGDKECYSYNGFIRDEPIKVRNKYYEEADARVLFKKISVREENTAYLYFDEPIGAKSSSNSAYSLLTNLNVYYICER